MSAFDDEFGLFGDDEVKEDEERKPTLGARRIASNETIIDDIELEDGGPPRRRDAGNRGPAAAGGFPRRGDRPRREQRDRPPLDSATSQRRAAELLYFLAQKLVQKPHMIAVQTAMGDRGPVLELEVDHEDIGKVIGRSGRVAQALRTIVRAGAEGKVSVEIIEVEEDEEGTDATAKAETEVHDA